MSCDRGYGIKGYPTCSRHASACIDNKRICDAGWSSIGDMELREGYDCDMHHMSLLLGRIATVIAAVVSMVFVLRYIYNEEVWMTKNTFFSIKNVFFSATIGVNVLTIVISSLKIHNPRDYHFGLDYYTSITSIFMGFCINSIEMSFTLIFIKFLNGYSRFLDVKRREHLKISTRWMTKILPIVPFVFASELTVLFVISLHSPRDKNDNGCIAFIWIVIAHYAFVGICLEYIVYIFLTDVGSYLLQTSISTHATEEINSNDRGSSGDRDSFKNPRRLPELEILYKKLLRMNRILAPFYTNGILVNVAFAMWPFLRRKLEHLNIFRVLTLQLVGAGISWTVTIITVKDNLQLLYLYNQKVAPFCVCGMSR